MSRKTNSVRTSTISITIRACGPGWNLMKPRIQCVLVFRGFGVCGAGASWRAPVTPVPPGRGPGPPAHRVMNASFMLFLRRRIQSVVATVSGLRMEVVVVYRGRMRAPREARVVFWEGVRSGLGWQDAAVAAGFPRGGQVWFRAAGGVKGKGAGRVSGGSLSLGGRGEIGVGGGAGDGVRVIAARLG